MSEAAQLTQISDNVNQGYIAGRDFYLGDQYVVQETLYFEPDLQNVESSTWTTTPKAQELMAALETNRLIVLAGQELDDKTMVARHIAWLLREELRPEKVSVREWYRSSDPQKVETAFDDSATTLLLLPQVQPHHIGHRLNELSRLLQSHKNYAIITTDGSRADWQIQNGSPEERFWCDISWETYYGRPFLAGLLLQELTTDGVRLPEGLPQNLDSGSILAEKVTVEEAAARLRQPDRICQFAQWLQSQEAVTSRDIEKQIDQLGGDRAAIFQWYRQLGHADQLLALGLVLFDGLPDDQSFAAVEYLVSEAWRLTDPNLPHFDYQALSRLGSYFHLSEAGQDGARIETPSQKKRTALLQAAWELQRRRLLAVVPAMTRLLREFSPNGTKAAAKEDAEEQAPATWKSQLALGPGLDKTTPKVLPFPKSKRAKRGGKKGDKQDDPARGRLTQGAERELFSSTRRVEQLQRSVIESLSQIGLLSFDAVQASFQELAVDGSSGVQTVVAKALAAWRGEGHHERLFQVLQDWWAAGGRVTPPKHLAQLRLEGSDPLAGIRATVALALGYALQYDPPNQLSPQLLSLLKLAIADQNTVVRKRVLDVTLPLAAASHAQQLEDLLRDRLVEDQEQMYAIAFGIATAYSLRPYEAIRIVDRWYVMVRSQGPRNPDDLTITSRDRLLAAVALIYGYVRSEEASEFLTPDQAVAELMSVLTTETHPFVRTHALMAMGLQAVHNFELVASMLVELISEITLADRHNVISVFTRTYLNQRAQLSGGDGEVEIEGLSYPIWTRSARPLTPIEISLYAWLREEGNPVARQIAVQAFADFAATALERRERTFTIGPSESAGVKTTALRPVARNAPRLRRLPPLGHIAVFLAAPSHKTRILIRPLVAEMIAVERSQLLGLSETAVAAAVRGPGSTSTKGLLPLSPLASTVIDRWRRNDDPSLQGLARSVKVAFNLFRWRWVIILLACFASVSWQQWRAWEWSSSDPISVPDSLALQQRKIAPMRLAWNRWVPPFRKYKKDELAAILMKPAKMKKPRNDEEDQEDEAVARRPLSGPADRLRRAAELSLVRASKMALAALEERRRRAENEAELNKRLQDAHVEAQLSELKKQDLLWFLRNLPSIRTGHPLQLESEQQRAAISTPSPRLPAEGQQEQVRTHVLPQAADTLPSVAPRIDLSISGQADPVRQKVKQVPVQPPAPEPSWLQKHWPFRKKEPKKEPPEGARNGKG